MSLTVANTGGDFKPAPAGSHLARCYRIIDLGTQKVVWKGTEKAMKKIIIGWELHGDDADGNPLLTDDGRPLVVSRKFTPSLADKAALRAFLVAWRGKQFTNDELMGFSLKNIIGAWCMINISHEDRDGKTYANITGVSGVPSAIKKAGLPEGVNPEVMFDIDEPNMEVFESFTDYIKDQIMSSPEWQMKNGEHKPQGSKKSSGDDEEDDDIPF